MNKFDAKYEIRLAQKKDIANIMQFIECHWKAGHIMAHDRDLFEYEYVNGNDVNFIIAIEREKKTIEAIFGFLNCSHHEDAAKKYVWGSIWKVVEGNDNLPLLGIELARRVKELTGCRAHIGNGANPKTTIPLRKIFFKEKVARMNHYYLLNADIKVYKIAVVQQKELNDSGFFSDHARLEKFGSMQEVNDRFDIDNVEAVPYKDSWYVEKRFFNHPYYEYDVYGVQSLSRNIEAILVTRTVLCEGSKVLRIVDYIGDQSAFAGLGKTFQSMLKSNGYEYLDFYELGFEKKFIVEAGFKLKDEYDPNIIPNYFEPFLRENVEIWAHYQEEGTLFFKADGDQDRPNQIQER
ncbi:hypothetical protein CDO73_21885 [Saccharibacillus sp. O23]|uniref:hypothetical protein n=1 Tax=Saccharibacillus sp. O23 TaxID=2009338 RepID=UPI000B4E50B3|nr:hypothetical protein [Saccharibacillus sp. O23]OWR27588.1 hypothetical protein CDO73_21885 [Saccharibacillus sp. O23]